MVYKDFIIVTKETKSKKVAIYTKYSKCTILKTVNNEAEAIAFIDSLKV